jgi:hypothetical protein
MPTKDVLYLGDSSLETAAAYLSLILEHAGLTYDYVQSDETIPERLLAGDYRLYILSDYPSACLGTEAMQRIEDKVRSGASLLMIGGWESFQGQSGGYHGTSLAELLPVHISPEDDRINSADPCFVVPVKRHGITDGLPLQQPPLVAGYNRFVAKGAAEVILSVARYTTALGKGTDSPVHISRTSHDPFLVLGSWGNGKTAALASDLAPHWVGGFVDWGDTRESLVGTDREVEVGGWYLQFVRQLLAWCGVPSAG